MRDKLLNISKDKSTILKVFIIIIVFCLAVIFIAKFITDFYDNSKQNENNRFYFSQKASDTDIPDSLSSIPTAECFLVDNEKFGCVYSQNAQKKQRIASLTKMMTAIIVMDNCDTDELAIVTTNDTSLVPTENIKKGDIISVGDLLNLMLHKSSNAAADTLCVHAGYKILTGTTPHTGFLHFRGFNREMATECFVGKMNEKAREYGMYDTLYANATGLDASLEPNTSYSTATDVLIVAKNFMSYPVLHKIVGEKEGSVTVKRGINITQISSPSNNECLKLNNDCIGIKTGFTDDAGYCVAECYENEWGTSYVIVLKSETSYSRFSDANTLYNSVISTFYNYDCLNLIQDNNSSESNVEKLFAKIPISNQPGKYYDTYIKNKEYNVELCALKGPVTQSICAKQSGEIAQDENIGHVDFIQDGEVIYSEDLFACEDVPNSNLNDILSGIFKSVCLIFTQQDLQNSPIIYNKLYAMYNPRVN